MLVLIAKPQPDFFLLLPSAGAWLDMVLEFACSYWCLLGVVNGLGQIVVERKPNQVLIRVSSSQIVARYFLIVVGWKELVKGWLSQEGNNTQVLLLWQKIRPQNQPCDNKQVIIALVLNCLFSRHKRNMNCRKFISPSQ